MDFLQNNMKDDFKITISECENMAKDKVIILCNPELRFMVESILSIAQDKLEEDKEKG